MKHIDRPTQITTILKTIDSGDDAEISAELETYIADLEARKPGRPTRIAAILRTIDSQYPADMGISLEVYIFDLEAKQQADLPGNDHTPPWNPNNPPAWSRQRSVEHEQRSRERALKKKNTYQQ